MLKVLIWWSLQSVSSNQTSVEQLFSPNSKMMMWWCSTYWLPWAHCSPERALPSWRSWVWGTRRQSTARRHSCRPRYSLPSPAQPPGHHPSMYPPRQNTQALISYNDRTCRTKLHMSKNVAANEAVDTESATWTCEWLTKVRKTWPAPYHAEKSPRKSQSL